MNVFASDPSPVFSAQVLADQHVVKMALESAQILSTALHIRGRNHTSLYRPTHKHHPCTVAAAKDDHYFWWVYHHGRALAGEYLLRFGKEHGALNRIELAGRVMLSAAPYGDPMPTTWPLAMPDEYKHENPHEAYINYLREKYRQWAGKKMPPRWKRVVPNNPFVTLRPDDTATIVERA